MLPSSDNQHFLISKNLRSLLALRSALGQWGKKPGKQDNEA